MPIQIRDMKQPRNLAVDWIAKRLYIIDSLDNHIYSTNLDGGERIKITDTGPNPLDIVVEPSSRVMIWSTLDNGIISDSLDGSNKQTLILHGVEWPTSLCIDYPTQRLYWADQRKGTVETSLLNGMDRHIIKRFQTRSKRTFE